jgi:hypothetical protein
MTAQCWSRATTSLLLCVGSTSKLVGKVDQVRQSSGNDSFENFSELR